MSQQIIAPKFTSGWIFAIRESWVSLFTSGGRFALYRISVIIHVHKAEKRVALPSLKSSEKFYCLHNLNPSSLQLWLKVGVDATELGYFPRFVELPLSTVLSEKERNLVQPFLPVLLSPLLFPIFSFFSWDVFFPL